MTYLQVKYSAGWHFLDAEESSQARDGIESIVCSEYKVHHVMSPLNREEQSLVDEQLPRGLFSFLSGRGFHRASTSNRKDGRPPATCSDRPAA
jgi:hypothetical protein